MRGHRIERADKVRGRTMFVDDLREDSLGFAPLDAVAVTAPFGPGLITKIRSDQALAMAGVTAVIIHQNAPRLRKVISLSMSEPGARLPLQWARIDCAGQVVALVVAESLQAARDGAAKVHVELSADSHTVVRLEDAGPA